MGKCQCTRLIFVWRSWLVFPCQDSLSLCYAINPLYALIVCVVHRGRSSCAFIAPAPASAALLDLPMVAVDISAARGQSPLSPSATQSLPLLLLTESRRVMLTTYKCTSCWWTHTHTHTCRQALAHMCVVMHELSYHARTQRCSLSLSLAPIEDDAKGDNVKRQLFETISTHCRRRTHTQATICRLGWNKTNTSRVAGAIIANPLCV